MNVDDSIFNSWACIQFAGETSDGKASPDSRGATDEISLFPYQLSVFASV